LRELLYILGVALASLAGLAAFEAWSSAGLYFSATGFAAFYVLRRHEKHDRSEVYNGKLSAERMEAAREWLSGILGL